jgi:tripartite-type tricarboxylate transporter receptor subunit TctC
MVTIRNIAVLGVGLLLAGAAAAQGYPSRSIQVISPVQAGSAGDTSLRILTQKMAQNMSQAITVENLPGAAGMIGVDRLAQAVPDGYTIGGISDSTLTYVPIVQRRTGFDPLAALEPVSLVAESTWVLIVHSSVPATNVKELIALAHARPGKLDYASAGVGGSHHVVMEMFKAATRSELTHIPFRGAAQAALDVQSGRVPVMFSALSVALASIRDGRLRALAVAAEARSPLLPEVPTLAESGVPGFVFSTWTGIFAPKRTPRPILERLNAEVQRALGDPAVREQLLALGATPRPTTPGELEDLTRRTYAKMAKVIAAAGIKAD